MRGRCLLVKLYISILTVGPNGTQNVPQAHQPLETNNYINSNNSVCPLSIVLTSRALPSPQPGVPEMPRTHLMSADGKPAPAPSASTGTDCPTEGMPLPDAIHAPVLSPRSQNDKHSSCTKRHVPSGPQRSETC